MEVAVDSHALFWYLSKNPKLSQKASKALDQSPRIIVSVIVLLEIMYLLEKYGQEAKFKRVLEGLSLERYLIYPVDLALVKECVLLPKSLEMHDRLIVATAKIFKAPLITKDKEITGFYKKVIW